MARTRAKAGKKGTSEDVETTMPSPSSNPSGPIKLPPSASNPPVVFILPKLASSSARIVSLVNPRYGKPTRYLLCPETGVYEFTRVASPQTVPRSWLIQPTSPNGSVALSQTPDLHVATKVDTLFLLMPALFATSTHASTDSADSKRLFLSLDHHLDILTEIAPHMSTVIASERIRTLFDDAIRSVCDSVEAGDETMYRANETKLLDCLLQKARRLAEPTLPPSMEDKFVESALSMPVTNAPSSCPGAAPNGSADEASKDESGPVGQQNQPSAEVARLQRVKVAFKFVCAGYLPPTLTKKLEAQLSESGCAVDFSPLDDYLSQLAKLKQEAMATRPALDYSRKRGAEDNDEAAERAEKKRKKEDEEKRKKAGVSRGVRDLKKVNVSGMKKMSDFFKKK